MLMLISLMLVACSLALFLACRKLCATQDERDALKGERDDLSRKLTAETHRAEGLAWVLRNPVVDSPILGPTKEHHLADAVAALDVELTDDEVKAVASIFGL